MPDPSLLNRVRIVLCGTSHPGNIGASARAMKTMGLASLYLVNPIRFPAADAEAMASGAADVLDTAIVCGSIDEALAGTVFAVACTARSRDLSHPVLTARETGARLVREAAQGPVALVFGPEQTGLTGREVSRCGAIGMIPANPDYTSLNLAAAVQIFAYEVRQAAEAVASYPQETYRGSELRGSRVLLPPPRADALRHRVPRPQAAQAADAAPAPVVPPRTTREGGGQHPARHPQRGAKANQGAIVD